MEPPNIDAAEQSHFDSLATDWWDPSGRLHTLHAINPLRLDYIRRHVSLEQARVLDVGCGGGILSEAMARNGATVTGIDISAPAIDVARDHARAGNIPIEYLVSTPEAYADSQPQVFDLVTCLEMLEHVPDPDTVIRACSKLVKPGGHLVFSTINRTLPAWALAIVAAEYVLQELPRGTHHHDHFIRPSELNSSCRQAGIRLDDITGMNYIPFINRATFSDNTAVNYLAHGLRIVDTCD